MKKFIHFTMMAINSLITGNWKNKPKKFKKYKNIEINISSLKSNHSNIERTNFICSNYVTLNSEHQNIPLPSIANTNT